MSEWCFINNEQNGEDRKVESRESDLYVGRDLTTIQLMAVDGFNPPLVIPEYVLVCEVPNGNTPTETREAVFVHACTMAPECRSSAYIQTINAATNVEIFLRNGCHFPMLI